MEKLKKVHIKNIGKFTDQIFNFCPGFNAFYAPNGCGKTTFATSMKTHTFTDRFDEEEIVGDMFGWAYYFHDIKKNLYFTENSSTKIVYENNSVKTLKYKNHSFKAAMKPKFTNIPILTEKLFMQMLIKNNVMGGLKTLDDNHFKLQKSEESRIFYDKVNNHFGQIIKGPTVLEGMENAKNMHSKISNSSFNKIRHLKTKDELLRLVSEMHHIIKRRVLIVLLSCWKVGKKIKLEKLYSAIVKNQKTSLLLEEIIKSEKFNFNKFKIKVNESIYYQADQVWGNFSKETKDINRLFLFKNIGDIGSKIKKYKQEISNDKLTTKNKSAFINKELKFHPLLSKIKINDDLSIVDKKNSSKKNSIPLSTAEIRLLTIVIFMFEKTDYKTLILDDPVATMDHNNIYFIKNLLYKKSVEGKQIIVLTHNRNFFQQLTRFKFDKKFKHKFYEINNKSNFNVELKRTPNNLESIFAELKSSNSIYTIPSLIRQILELLSTMINSRGEIKSFFDVEENKIKFLGIEHTFITQVTIEMIHDLTHLKSFSSHSRWENKNFVFSIKKDFVKFFRKIIKGIPTS